MEIILANDYTNDPFARRAVRLDLIEANICHLDFEFVLNFGF